MTAPTSNRFHLVVGVDDSASSQDAIRFAATVTGQHQNASITLVFVEAASMLATMSAAATEAVLEMWDSIDGDIKKFAHAKLDPLPISWEYQRRRGAPAEQIDEVARAEQADAVVVGRASHRAIHGPLGSVPVRLTHSAPSPVIIVP